MQRAVRWAKYLPDHGFQVYVVCNNHEGLMERTERIIPIESRASLLERVMPYNDRLPWVPHAVQACEELISRVPISAVISTSPPPATHLAALSLKKRKDIPWVADFRDPLLGNPARNKLWGRPYDAILQRRILSSADAVTAVSDVMAEAWRRKYKHRADKLSVIWNGFDAQDGIGPAEIPRRDTKILLHAGVLYQGRHPFQLIGSLRRLFEKGKLSPAQVTLRLVGPVENEQVLRSHPDAAALLEIGSLDLQSSLVPRSEAIHMTARADYLLLLDLTNESNAGYTVPAKLYEYILVGRPILAITAPQSPVERILEKSGVPYTCLHPGDSAGQVDEKMCRFLATPNCPTTPSDWFVENFDGSRQVKLLVSILNRLT